MIRTVVSYDGDELELVQMFERCTNKRAEIWQAEEFKGVKKTIKDHYLKQQSFTCQFCRRPWYVANNRGWDVEHIIPKSTHPALLFEPLNLCVVCPDCNQAKSDQNVLVKRGRKTLQTSSDAYLIVHPHFDKYEDHFHVVVPSRLYRSSTGKGAKTIKIYGLYRFLNDAERAFPAHK